MDAGYIILGLSPSYYFVIITDVRKRFTDFFSVEIDKINHLIQSKQSSRGIRLFGHDVMNLRKLLKDSHLWDRQTYSSYKNVAVQDKQVIEKFIPGMYAINVIYVGILKRNLVEIA